MNTGWTITSFLLSQINKKNEIQEKQNEGYEEIHMDNSLYRAFNLFNN